MTAVAQDEDGLRDSPWYVRFLLRVGVPTAFASVLLWFLLTNVTGTLSVMRDQQLEMVMLQETIIGNQVRILQLMSEHERSSEHLSMVMQALCYNAATDADERQRCGLALK